MKISIGIMAVIFAFSSAEAAVSRRLKCSRNATPTGAGPARIDLIQATLSLDETNLKAGISAWRTNNFKLSRYFGEANIVKRSDDENDITVKGVDGNLSLSLFPLSAVTPSIKGAIYGTIAISFDDNSVLKPTDITCYDCDLVSSKYKADICGI